MRARRFIRRYRHDPTAFSSIRFWREGSLLVRATHRAVERRVPTNARSLEGGGLDCCQECDRRHADLERGYEKDRRRKRPSLRLVI